MTRARDRFAISKQGFRLEAPGETLSAERVVITRARDRVCPLLGAYSDDASPAGQH